MGRLVAWRTDRDRPRTLRVCRGARRGTPERDRHDDHVTTYRSWRNTMYIGIGTIILIIILILVLT